MGVIYRARHPGTGRDLALKILPPALAAEEEFRLRFDREARALAGLSHPNIVRLHDYGVERDLMFLVMEFIDGVTLRQLLRREEVDPPRALAIALDLCKALEFAHKERVIHRDVKPDNVLVDRAGRVKLTDFGLAIRIDAESARVTQTNYAVGTPHYMAPEQLEHPEEIDQRVDIYSLGVLLYELLTHELPIGRFPLPSKRAAVDPAFDTIICRCLEKDPESRYPTMAELRAALMAVPGAPRPEVAVPTPPRPRISSNLEIRCACGWQFFVPAGAVAGVHCPSCGERVTLESRTPRPAEAPAAAPATSPQGRSPLIALALAASVLVLLVGGLLALALSPSPKRRTDPDARISFQPEPLVPIPAPTPPPAQPPTVLAPAPPAGPRVPVAQLRARLDALTAEADLTGIVATILLNSGRPQDHDQLHQRLASIDLEARELLKSLDAQGQRTDALDRFQFGDRLLTFAGRRMDPAHSLAFADDLKDWLRTFRPGATGTMTVARKKQQISFAFRFPDLTADMMELARVAGVTLGEAPAAVVAQVASKPPSVSAMPAGLLDPLRVRLAALSKAYRDLLPYEDRGRAEALLLAGQGTSDDAAFLTGRFPDLLRRAEEEQKQIAVRLRDLEARSAEFAAQADAVVCKDGRRIEGAILEDDETHVKVRARFGAVTIARNEILRVEKGKGSAAEFRTAYVAAAGRKDDLQRLATLARDRKLAPQLELAALAVVALDPSDERCRADAGLPRSPFAAAIAVEPADPTPAGGRIEYLGRSFTPEQLRQELRSLGYALLNGVWCEKVTGSVKADNLYRDEARIPVQFRGGASVLSQTHTERDTIYDYQTKSWVPRTKKVSDARYIGGGSCLLEVSAPGPLIEARVHARSQVAKAGGHVTVSVVIDPNEMPGKILFTVSGPGENNGSHDATEKVAGHNRFWVLAQTSGTGMFLISDSNDLGVFEVKYTYGRPLERVNALLNGAAPVEAPAPAEIKPNYAEVEVGCRAAAASACRLETFVDALLDIRRRTDVLFYGREYSMPDRFTEVAVQLRDPLDPDWNGLSREQAIHLGGWWGRLPIDERREFLAAYGLWCARARFLRAPR
jgi:serine/threonine protein kinase